MCNIAMSVKYRVPRIEKNMYNGIKLLRANVHLILEHVLGNYKFYDPSAKRNARRAKMILAYNFLETDGIYGVGGGWG